MALFENQMRVAAIVPYPAIGLGGDSGSLVVSKEEAVAVGLYSGPPSAVEFLGRPRGICRHSRAAGPKGHRLFPWRIDNIPFISALCGSLGQSRLRP